jgi:hypothetical protein
LKSHCLNSGRAQQPSDRRVAVSKWAILSAIAVIALPSTKLVNAQVPTPTPVFYIVNTTSDTVVAGACANGNAGCSLRGATQEANAHVGDDGIEIDLPAGSVINLTSALPDLSESVSISGPGADQLTVRRNTGGDYRIFNVIATGTVTLAGMTISNGFITQGGGAISNGNGTANVINCTLIGNNTDTIGGGILNSGNGTVNVTNCTLTANNATNGGGGSGGGIANAGTVNITNSTLSENSAGAGGGIYNFASGTVNVTNSTIDNNSASGTGGGIENFRTVNISNCTIAQNVAAAGGGIAGSATVKSTIIASNMAGSGPDVSGAVTSAGFNLIGKTDGSTGFTQPTDLTGTIASPLDPKFDPNGLQNNGGPTQTIALLPTSPAIDKATSIGLTGTQTTDQRGTGFPRTFDDPMITNATGGDGTDIGAFEVQAPSPSPTPTPTTFGNISTRLRVETGDNVLIGGFIITGAQAKKVMVRAIGPSLPLVGVLADPTLELHDGAGTLITSNDNWMDAPNRQEIIDSTLAPTNDLESAILTTLDPGLYTAIVRGVNDTTGIGLVEAYDLELAADSILANISTRGLVQTGDNVMIGGIIILGTDAQEVLLRAIGPSLPVAGALADPTLELHDKDGVVIAGNDNWRSDQEADIIATTIPPTNDAESAILMTLAPDAYTAIVRGKGNTTGVALVEAYQLDN